MLEVVASIIEQDGKFLIALRGEKEFYGGFWEFPGGKIEAGEAPQECLAREIKEELGIDCKVGEFVAEGFFDYGEGKDVHLRGYLTQHLSGEFALNVHSEIRWIEKHEFKNFEFPPADLPIIEALLKK